MATAREEDDDGGEDEDAAEAARARLAAEGFDEAGVETGVVVALPNASFFCPDAALDTALPLLVMTGLVLLSSIGLLQCVHRAAVTFLKNAPNPTPLAATPPFFTRSI